jgi:hypothetical protein
MLTSAECSTDGDCGPFNFRETPVSKLDTFSYYWPAPRVWIEGLYDEHSVVHWEHRDSVRFEFNSEGVTYEDWKVRFTGNRYNDSSFSYWIHDSLGAQQKQAATIDCSPASWNIATKLKIFIHKDKHLVTF